MFDARSRSNSYIELSEIRKLDNLLTQCESTSCENICMDCCAQLGSIDNIVSTKSSSCSAVISIANSNIACNAGMKKSTMPVYDVDMDKFRFDNVMEKSNKSENDVRNGEDEKQSTNNCRFCDKNLREDFANARFFSLDKERTEKLETKPEVEKGGSENTLETSRKLCTFKEFEEPARNQASKVDNVNVKTATQDSCEKCNNDQSKKLLATNLFAGAQKKISRGKSIKDKAISLSSKSSQSSFKDGAIKSTKREALEKENFNFRESLRSKFSPQNLAKKITGKGLYEECEIIKKEVLFGEWFDAFHHEIKIPERVEAALPMVTIIVGKVVPNSNTADLITCCDGADDPRRAQFQLNNLTPGLPRSTHMCTRVSLHPGRRGKCGISGNDLVALLNGAEPQVSTQ